MEELIGVRPKSDKDGILQDIHWAGGMFGYFPSYALGSAIAAQLFHHMESIMPIKQYLEEGKLFTEEYPNSVTDRRDWSHNRNTKPYVDLYFQKNMKNKPKNNYLMN